MQINRRPLCHGFTLVELLVVIAIIAVLATFSVAALSRFRKVADRTAAINAMRQIQLGNISYATENNGMFVPSVVDVVDGSGTPTGVRYLWFENPNFINQLKGDKATFSGGSQPDVTVPASMLDLAVIRTKSLENTNLGNCFGYTAPSAGSSYRQAQLINPVESAAFITCDEPFVDHATKSKIAYRHQTKALVAFYDGRVAVMTAAEINLFDTRGGASSHFWSATGVPTPP